MFLERKMKVGRRRLTLVWVAVLCLVLFSISTAYAITTVKNGSWTSINGSFPDVFYKDRENTFSCTIHNLQNGFPLNVQVTLQYYFGIWCSADSTSFQSSTSDKNVSFSIKAGTAKFLPNIKYKWRYKVWEQQITGTSKTYYTDPVWIPTKTK